MTHVNAGSLASCLPKKTQEATEKGMEEKQQKGIEKFE